MKRVSPPPAQPAQQPTRVGKAPIAPGVVSPSDEGRELALPHERDQSSGETDPRPTEVMKQAHRDLQCGQVDTDMRATPGLDARRRRKLVPPAR